MQQIIKINDDYTELYDYIKLNNISSLLLVKDSSFRFFSVAEYIKNISTVCNCKLVEFDDFEPNPLYESVVKGVKLFQAEHCNAVIAVGGGSAIDVAKCIKLYSTMDSNTNFLKQEVAVAYDSVKLIAVPTTAGTGSETTKFAVIYLNGEKQSISDNKCIPNVTVLDKRVLYSLPDYQRKSTLCDALFHAIEAYWSINSTEESKQLSIQSIKSILGNYKRYIDGDKSVCAEIQEAAYVAGQAINITQTTAGHAMSYKLTSMYKISHGHAVALVNVSLIKYMIAHLEYCTDKRGSDYLKGIMNDLANLFNVSSYEYLASAVKELVLSFNFTVPNITSEELSILAKSVNPIRMKNNPIPIDEKAATEIYLDITKR